VAEYGITPALEATVRWLF